MATKKDDACLKKAYNDEKLFVLMARDTFAPLTVLEWIKMSFYNQPDDKLREAFECALTMKNTRGEMEYRKALEEKGWTVYQHECPPPNSLCTVLFSDHVTEGECAYWTHEEGFDAQTEPHHLEVIAWKNPIRNA